MKRVSSGIAVIALSCFAALGGCVGSMPSKMVIEVDGDSAYEAVITIIEGDDSLEKIWQRTGRPRGVPLIPVKAPDPNRAKDKTSLVLEGDIIVTLDNTPMGPNKSVALSRLELVRDAVTDDVWFLPEHQVRAIQDIVKNHK